MCVCVCMVHYLIAPAGSLLHHAMILHNQVVSYHPVGMHIARTADVGYDIHSDVFNNLCRLHWIPSNYMQVLHFTSLLGSNPHCHILCLKCSILSSGIINMHTYIDTYSVHTCIPVVLTSKAPPCTHFPCKVYNHAKCAVHTPGMYRTIHSTIRHA